MTEELTRSLKRQLGASKAKLTNFRKFLDELNLDSLTDETIINLEQRQKSSLMSYCNLNLCSRN